MNFKINIPFTCYQDTDTHGSAMVDDMRIGGIAYGTLPQVKKALRKIITDRIDEALTTKDNGNRRIIFCVDGTILIVEYRNSWGYSIVGPNRGQSSCIIGDNFSEALVAASHHAEESYGGVKDLRGF